MWSFNTEGFPPNHGSSMLYRQVNDLNMKKKHGMSSLNALCTMSANLNRTNFNTGKKNGPNFSTIMWETDKLLLKTTTEIYWCSKALQDFKSNCGFLSVTALANKDTLEYYFPVLLKPPSILNSIVSCQQYDLISESILCCLNGAWFEMQCASSPK